MKTTSEIAEMIVCNELHRIENWDSLSPERKGQFLKSAVRIGTDGFKPDTKDRLTALFQEFGLKDKSPC